MSEYIKREDAIKAIGGLRVFEKNDFNELIDKATKEHCDITVAYKPDGIEIIIQPRKPFRYYFPYTNTTQKED